MIDPTALTILLLAWVGHYGIHLAFYNRLNCLGWPRKRIKRVVKAAFANAVLLPPLVLALYWQPLLGIVQQNTDWAQLPAILRIYGSLCLASVPLLGIPWLIYRPLFGINHVKIKVRGRLLDARDHCSEKLPRNGFANWVTGLPLNQVLKLSVEEIELPVAGLPEALDGYRIAHLSDIHLTGDIDWPYSRLAMEQALSAAPDMFALTGDIVDCQETIQWLPKIFGDASAPDGCYFVLGNHDTRVSHPDEVRQQMETLGWQDLGNSATCVDLRDVPSLLAGNESPWFPRVEINQAQRERAEFRLLLSHSPDQIRWARQHAFTLMLAGHTHGGQGRLPLVGPLLSPSVHGSRFASGSFYLAPTTMQVSRGLHGNHLMRINCPPQVALLTLRTPSGKRT